MNKHNPITIEEASNTLFFSAFSVPNPDDFLHPFAPKSWSKLTDEEKKIEDKAYEKINLESRPEDRTDPLLIKVVEKLGNKASGTCASLKVIEIPDGIKWEITEYDGLEQVEEIHNSWG